METSYSRADLDPERIQTEERFINVQIPRGLQPGETFLATQPDGEVITVTVPPGALPGSFVDVVVPTSDLEGENNTNQPAYCLKKPTVGGAVVGAVVGTLLLGPIGGLLFAGAGAAAGSNSNTIKSSTRSASETTMDTLSNSKNWIEKQIKLYNNPACEEDGDGVAGTGMQSNNTLV